MEAFVQTVFVTEAIPRFKREDVIIKKNLTKIKKKKKFGRYLTSCFFSLDKFSTSPVLLNFTPPHDVLEMKCWCLMEYMHIEIFRVSWILRDSTEMTKFLQSQIIFIGNFGADVLAYGESQKLASEESRL